jgi:hypothetical protein
MRSRVDVEGRSPDNPVAPCAIPHGDQPTADWRSGTSDLGVAMSAAQPPQNQTLTVLVDDVRAFKDERPALIARSSQDALTLLDDLGNRRIDHLWLTTTWSTTTRSGLSSNCWSTGRGRARR